MHKAQITKENIPEKRNICIPPPPSNTFNPEIRIAELRLYPNAMTGARIK